MTDLQLALIGLGVLIIVAIVLFNWWQERKLRTGVSQRFDEPQQNALMDEFHFDSDAILKNDPAPKFDESEVNQTIAEPAVLDSTGINNAKLPASVNQQTDLIALLYLPQPATGAALREFLLLLADIDKPIYAHGLDSDDVWHPLTREQEGIEFTHAAYSLQLADRSGFVSKTSLSRFQQATDNMANKLGAQVEWQGSGDPWLFADELDQFCAEVDKMVGFHLVQGDSGPFTGTKFRGLAEASGLILKEDGGFHYESEPGHESDSTQKLFSVINQDNNPFNTEMLRTSVIHGVSFQLDIPRVKNCIEVFNQMVLMARQMKNSLNGNLVDDKGCPLDEAQIDKIRQQLKVIYAKMVARNVVPGSDSALRLFS